MSLVIRTNRDADKVVVGVTGEVDVSNAPELRDAIDAELAADPAGLLVDLADVPYIDSTGIGVLVGAAHRAKDAGVSLVVTNPQRNVARVLAMLGVDGELGIPAE